MTHCLFMKSLKTLFLLSLPADPRPGAKSKVSLFVRQPIRDQNALIGEVLPAPAKQKPSFLEFQALS